MCTIYYRQINFCLHRNNRNNPPPKKKNKNEKAVDYKLTQGY